MAKIRPNSSSIQRRTQLANQKGAQQQETNRQQALKTDVGNAKTTVATTVGRQGVKTQDDEKATETPKAPQEQVTLSSAGVQEPVKEAKSEEGFESQFQTQTQTQQAASQTQSAPSQEKTFEDSQMAFINTLAESTSEDEKKVISELASETLSKFADSDDPLAGPISMAVGTRDFAKKELARLMPGASKTEIMEAAKTDPEIARLAGLRTSANGLIDSVKSQPAAGASAPTNGDPGSSAASSADGAGATPGPSPFPRDSGSGGGESGGGDGVPPTGGEPNSSYHLPLEEQAQLMAKTHEQMAQVQATNNRIAEIYQQMFADMMKSAAQRFQIMQTMRQDVSDIHMSIYARQQQSQAKHFSLMLQTITEAW